MTASSRLPPALNIIALATFAASLSARALDPVLPHVADDFGVSIATAAGFAAVFAFTFAIIQPVLGAAADMFGKARLMIVCLVLLGLANILGAMANSFSAVVRHRAFSPASAPAACFRSRSALTSDLVGPEKRQIAIGRTLAGAMTGNLLGASVSGLIGDFLGWRGVLAVLGVLVIVASIAVAAGFRGAALTRPPRTQFCRAQAGLSHDLHQSEREVLLRGGLHRRLLRARTVSLHRGVPVRTRRNQPVDRRHRHRGLCGRRAVLHADGVALSAAARRQRHDDRGRRAGRPATRSPSRWVRTGRSRRVSLLFMGWGFYMIHGCLQVFASELSVEARATALSLHSFFFFMGQTIGPIAYGFGIQHAGKVPTLLTAAAIMIALGIVCARLLRQTRPADAAAT